MQEEESIKIENGKIELKISTQRFSPKKFKSQNHIKSEKYQQNPE